MSSEGVHPATAALLRWFDYEHLPEHLQAVSAPFRTLVAGLMFTHRLEGAELTAALRKLLEAKDCAVRAAILKHEAEQ